MVKSHLPRYPIWWNHIATLILLHTYIQNIKHHQREEWEFFTDAICTQGVRFLNITKQFWCLNLKTATEAENNANSFKFNNKSQHWLLVSNGTWMCWLKAPVFELIIHHDLHPMWTLSLFIPSHLVVGVKSWIATMWLFSPGCKLTVNFFVTY